MAVYQQGKKNFPARRGTRTGQGKDRETRQCSVGERKKNNSGGENCTNFHDFNLGVAPKKKRNDYRWNTRAAVTRGGEGAGDRRERDNNLRAHLFWEPAFIFRLRRTED